MYNILLGVYLLVAVALIVLVLIQQGKGADMGASFGSGASNTVFGSGGSGNFLTRSTAVFAVLFFIISLVLGRLSSHPVNDASQWDNLGVSQSATQSAPAEQKAPSTESVPAKPQSPADQVPE